MSYGTERFSLAVKKALTGKYPSSDARESSLVKSISILSSIAILALTTGVLYLGRALFVPLALAILFAFVLKPVVMVLERGGFHRFAAVALVIVVTLAAPGGFGYMLYHQLDELSAQMSGYSGSLRKKVASLHLGTRGPFAKIQETIAEVSEETSLQSDSDNTPSIRVAQPIQGPIERAWSIVHPVFDSLTTGGIVLVLLLFMLVQREDTRNRFIRLVGRSRVTVTTRMMDEITDRIGRFLLSQLAINAGFGVVIT